MTETVFLRDLVVVLAAAITAVALLRHVGVPSIAGFIIAGVLIGPRALGLVGDGHHVEVLAETGVILLLFGIGLELSLERFRRLWRPILVGGTLQVGMTLLVVLGASRLLGWDVRSGFLLGFVLAVSSTAIVLRGLSARGELETPHGRLTLGILIFQDLCVVPMVLVIPLLVGDAGSGADILDTLLTATAVVAGVLLASWLLVPRFLEAVARMRRRDLFVLAVFLVCLGTAWLVSFAGVSLARGAFLAGLVVSGSRYREQAISELVPLRDLLASVFFVSIGMLLDLATVTQHLLPVVGLFVAIVAGKFVIVSLSALFMALPMRMCILSGAALAQVGEFSFILLHAAGGAPPFDEPFGSNLTAAIILSMLATPFAIALAPRLAGGAGGWNPLTRLLRVRTAEETRQYEPLGDHVIVAGYGLGGLQLAAALRERAIRYVIVDVNVDNVREATARGEPAFYGDVTSPEVLEHLGLHAARELVITINDLEAAVRATRSARAVRSGLSITVRTSYEVDVPLLRDAGASWIISSEAAAATAVVEHVVGRLAPEGAGQEQARGDRAG